MQLHDQRARHLRSDKIDLRFGLDRLILRMEDRLHVVVCRTKRKTALLRRRVGSRKEHESQDTINMQRLRNKEASLKGFPPAFLRYQTNAFRCPRTSPAASPQTHPPPAQ